MAFKEKAKSFYLQCTRVWQLLKKPSSEEFNAVSKVSALGIMAMGAVGFLISDLIKILFK